MKKAVLVSLLGISAVLNAQSYPPPAGQTGSTAIAASDPSIVAWATEATVVRGKQDISNASSALASFGTPSLATGAPSGSTLDVVSLGDGGSATVTFALPITNETGYDFAVFENSFSDTFLELAFVEVSSDGVNFFRFPSHSQTQTTTQIGGFGAVDCRYINNLAGKYKINYGTPFNLDDVPNNALLNKNSITHVKVIDVVGSINATYATYDSYGNKINDPFTTPFNSGGFDLDAVGVIHQAAGFRKMNDEKENMALFSIYPNPATDVVFLNTEKETAVVVYDLSGRIVKNLPAGEHKEIRVSDLTKGTYLFEVTIGEEKITKRIIVK
ncbi:T9SS type A sorting domain-containing protein [Flavobacterium humi]|uniref:T9SS type A sorting domain-containing protein n=1 Tax=Flavobacterium humi TaxID=2562683 RepID=A0A4Z0L6S3_9FLAO|nr:T9SS type A sorting domain-containing protein [Flavobacterium humi]TGD56685.1 T9SS type A sorting domain-containing protein [Flavobacterium humi]